MLFLLWSRARRILVVGPSRFRWKCLGLYRFDSLLQRIITIRIVKKSCEVALYVSEIPLMKLAHQQRLEKYISAIASRKWCSGISVIVKRTSGSVKRLFNPYKNFQLLMKVKVVGSINQLELLKRMRPFTLTSNAIVLALTLRADASARRDIEKRKYRFALLFNYLWVIKRN